MAFLRYFPGQEAFEAANRKPIPQNELNDDSNRVRSEFRYFTRLTPLASWRSEYLLRTRLLRSVARGKPGGSSGRIGSSARSQTSKKSSAVLTYNSKLPWMISNIHAVFDNAKKGPRVIVGTTDLCVSTVSDPSTGKVEKWGLDDPFSFPQLDEMFPNLEPFGVGSGPAAVYNVMDVSQPYGMIGGEGFPGGRPYYRATNELRGRYLGDADSSIIDMSPETPKIPELTEAICSVWVAKSSTVPSMTQNMIGMMTGSSLGVVTTYAVGHDASGPRFKAGEMTARWVLSPGVPIISLKIDENYSYRRKALGRIWACAVNALGECFVLTATPQAPVDAVRKDLDSNKTAWLAGRSVYWELIEPTRRQAQPDVMDKNAVRGGYSPRSPCDEMRLSKEQIIAEAREIEKFLRYEPAYFRRVCQNWDMRRRVEVDFAEETILITRCYQGQDHPAEILRLARSPLSIAGASGTEGALPTIATPLQRPSIFGSASHTPTSGSSSSLAPGSRTNVDIAPFSEQTDWQTAKLSLKKLGKADINVTAMDTSLYALLAPFEDPLNEDAQFLKNGVMTPTAKQSTGEIPGRRARLFGVGTDQGKVLLWNTRDTSDKALDPVCVIQTESPEITSLAISALYVVHGGSDGLVQAWDPLVSSSEPIRTLSSRSSGRAPRHILNANPALRHADYSACPAIFIDPDATSLRGILCFGTFVRYWTYSSTAQTVGRKRRLRHSDMHGRLASRRQGGAVMGYIAAEEAELRREQQHRAREDVRLRNRFGVGLGDLTEEEAVRYAQMISEEAFLLDEQRRTSASDTGSAADIGETNSTSGSLDTVTPDPSLSGRSPPIGISPATATAQATADDDDFEQQIQRALRLSLMEGGENTAHSPHGVSSTDFDFNVKYKPAKGKLSAQDSYSSSQAQTPLPQSGEASGQIWQLSPSPEAEEEIDEELALALRLSMEEEAHRQQAQVVESGFEDDGFPPLEVTGKGKGIARY